MMKATTRPQLPEVNLLRHWVRPLEDAHSSARLVESGPFGGDGVVSSCNSSPPGSRKASKDGGKVGAGVQGQLFPVEVGLTDVT